MGTLHTRGCAVTNAVIQALTMSGEISDTARGIGIQFVVEHCAADLKQEVRSFGALEIRNPLPYACA